MKIEGLPDATVTTKPAKRGSEPKAVITITVEGDQLAVKIDFTPCAKTKGPTHPAHRAAIKMCSLFVENQKARKP